MGRFKIEEIKGLEIELEGLESDLELERKFKDPILKKVGLNCEMNNLLTRSKPYFNQKPNSVCVIMHY